MNPTISAIIAVKNEEKYIKDCLESVKWVDEIILIDHYSTDRTVEIAKGYTHHIYMCDGGQYGLIEYNKNFGIKKATKNWVLIVDADERITPELKKEILEQIKKNHYDAFYFNFRQFFLGREFTASMHSQPKIIRLFKRWHGLYADVKPHSTISGYNNSWRMNSPIIHVERSIQEILLKINRYTTQEAQLLYKESCKDKKGILMRNRIKKLNIYNLVVRPLFYMPYYLIIKRNYQSGIAGLISAFLHMFYLQLKQFKLFELSANKNWHLYK